MLHQALTCLGFCRVAFLQADRASACLSRSKYWRNCTENHNGKKNLQIFGDRQILMLQAAIFYMQLLKKTTHQIPQIIITIRVFLPVLEGLSVADFCCCVFLEGRLNNGKIHPSCSEVSPSGHCFLQPIFSFYQL